MILALDTHYSDEKAKTVGVLFEQWTDESALEVFEDITSNPPEYEPGQFYKRELPCILNLLKKTPIHKLTYLVIDGYVFLNDDTSPGLGAYLYNELEQSVPVIGVAKSNYSGLEHQRTKILRGESDKPLFITSAGIEHHLAASFIASMHGHYRIPTLLKLADQIARGNS